MLGFPPSFSLSLHFFTVGRNNVRNKIITIVNDSWAYFFPWCFASAQYLLHPFKKRFKKYTLRVWNLVDLIMESMTTWSYSHRYLLKFQVFPKNSIVFAKIWENITWNGRGTKVHRWPLRWSQISLASWWHKGKKIYSLTAKQISSKAVFFLKMPKMSQRLIVSKVSAA